MKFDILKSWAKINLSLNVIKRFSNKYHNIESLVTFIDLFDEIKIKIINSKYHRVFFLGKFSKGIGKNNTIIKLLNLLEKNQLIKKKKFEIKVIKNIPHKSGLGGGSMNAASILRYLIEKNFFKISEKKIKNIAYKVGADVILGMKKKNTILFNSGRIARLNNKINFHVLITMPNFGCSTKNIFLRVRNFSKPLYLKENKSYFKKNNLVQSSNDLEDIVLKKYLKIRNLKHFLSNLPGAVFVRMTGSGSAVVAYFKSKNSAKNAAKIFRSKYKEYWYIVSKTI